MQLDTQLPLFFSVVPFGPLSYSDLLELEPHHPALLVAREAFELRMRLDVPPAGASITYVMNAGTPDEYQVEDMVVEVYEDGDIRTGKNGVRTFSEYRWTKGNASQKSAAIRQVDYRTSSRSCNRVV